MYIVPNTDIYLLSGVPLEKKQINQLYFNNQTSQINYFLSKVKYKIGDTTYQRYERNEIKLPLSFGNVIKCNYMMFKNNSYENKWFFAFIDDAEYVSDNVTKIKYTIDSIQSWAFNSSASAMYNFNDCYIERNHTVSDKLYEHLEPENINASLLPYKIQNNFLPLYIKIGAALITEDAEKKKKILDRGFRYEYSNNGLLSMLFVKYYSVNEQFQMSMIENDINTCTEAGATIAYLNFVLSSQTDETILTHEKVEYKDFNFSIENNIKIGEYSYTIKNNKLHSFPFSSFEMISSDGNKCEYMPQYLISDDEINNNNVKCRFVLSVCGNNTSSACMYPLKYGNSLSPVFYYHGIYTNNGECYDSYSVPLNVDIPTGYVSDAYREWYGQYSETLEMQNTSKQIKNLATVLVGVLGVAAAAYTGGSSLAIAAGVGTAITGAASGVAEEVNYNANINKQYNKGDSVTTGSSAILSVSQKRIGYYIVQKYPDPAQLHNIDRYFDLYGYAINRIENPLINNRPYYTYIKTRNLTLNESLPQDIENEITSLFDRGITFWKDPNEVGNYDVDNRATVR